MNELWQRMVAGAAQISSVVPALVGAFVILMTGYFLARQVQRWADDTLKRLRFDRMVSAGGFDEVVDRAGLRLDPVRALAMRGYAGSEGSLVVQVSDESGGPAGTWRRSVSGRPATVEAASRRAASSSS